MGYQQARAQNDINRVLKHDLPRSRFTRTSCPARVLLFHRQTSVPIIQIRPWLVIPISLTMERALAHEDVLLAHTPRLLDIAISIAMSEFHAIPLNEGFSCMQSSSGNCWLCRLSLAPSLEFPYCPPCFLLKFRTSWGNIAGWLRDMNSGLAKTLFLSLTLLLRCGAGMVVVAQDLQAKLSYRRAVPLRAFVICK